MRRLVQHGARWTVVTVDDVNNQVTVLAVGGGKFCVSGTGEKAIATAAQYTIDHGPQRDWTSRETAVSHLSDESWEVDAEGWLS